MDYRGLWVLAAKLLHDTLVVGIIVEVTHDDHLAVRILLHKGQLQLTYLETGTFAGFAASSS